MKFAKLILASGLTFVSSVASAGGLAPAVVETVEVVDTAPPASSLGGMLVPLILLALLAAAASSSETSDSMYDEL